MRFWDTDGIYIYAYSITKFLKRDEDVLSTQSLDDGNTT